MKFGICTAIDNLEILKNVGYDYIELGLSKVASLTEEELNDYRQLLDNFDMEAESYNGFFPSMKIVGPEADYAKIEEYAQMALEKAARLGGKAVVLGCGRQREVPEGYEREKAYEDFVRTARIVGDAAQKNGIVIALEPLNQLETNFFFTVKEGVQLMHDIAHPHVKVLADMYHVCRENEDFADIAAAGKDLVHVHIAAPTVRTYPKFTDEFDYSTFAAALKQAGYTARISIEGRLNGELAEEAPESLAVLKKYFA